MFRCDVLVLSTPFRRPQVAGFTRIAGCMTPVEKMQLLDSLFARFDTLATSHGVYKARSTARHARPARCVLTRAIARGALQVETIGPFAHY